MAFKVTLINKNDKKPVPFGILANTTDKSIGYTADLNGIANVGVPGTYLIKNVGYKDITIDINGDITIELETDSLGILVFSVANTNTIIKGNIVGEDPPNKKKKKNNKQALDDITVFLLLVGPQSGETETQTELQTLPLPNNNKVPSSSTITGTIDASSESESTIEKPVETPKSELIPFPSTQSRSRDIGIYERPDGNYSVRDESGNLIGGVVKNLNGAYTLKRAYLENWDWKEFLNYHSNIFVDNTPSNTPTVDSTTNNTPTQDPPTVQNPDNVIDFNVDSKLIILKTDRKGNFYFENNTDTFPDDIENATSVTIIINPPQKQDTNYQSKTIDLKSLFPNKETLPNKETIYTYDLGRIDLDLVAPPPEPKIETPEPKPKIPWELTLAYRILQLVKNFLKRVIPYLIQLLTVFGAEAVNAVLNRQPILSKVCPKEKDILLVIKRRNLLARQINNIYNYIKTLNSTVTGLNVFLTALNAAVALFPLNPIPSNATTVGAISAVENLKEQLKLTVDKVTKGLEGVEYVTAYTAAVLAYILYVLNALDGLISQCAKDQNVPFETINSELNVFTNQSTGVNNSAFINVDKTYKGFNLEIKLDESNKTQYPKRFAQALNKQGVPVLKTESSFASDPQVLVNQLKFIIDSNPNLTAE